VGQGTIEADGDRADRVHPDSGLDAGYWVVRCGLPDGTRAPLLGRERDLYREGVDVLYH